MYNILITVLLGIVSKLMTQAFFEKTILLGLHWISKRTDNTMDDAMMMNIATALDWKDWYESLK